MIKKNSMSVKKINGDLMNKYGISEEEDLEEIVSVFSSHSC